MRFRRKSGRRYGKRRVVRRRRSNGPMRIGYRF